MQWISCSFRFLHQEIAALLFGRYHLLSSVIKVNSKVALRLYAARFDGFY